MPDVGDPPLLEVDITGKSRQRDGEAISIIDRLAFTLRRRAVTCLLGPSGCGKTTALRIAMGLDAAFEGSVCPDPASLRLGVVFQDPRLLPWRTVEQNIRLAAPEIATAALDALLEELGLSEWRHCGPLQLSLGMARRAALARALAVDPDLLVLDEAFVSLDERSAEALRTVTFGAAARRAATVLMVTHNIAEAFLFSDEIIVLAPRPTSIVARLELDRERSGRNAEWLAAQRRRLRDLDTFFLDSD